MPLLNGCALDNTNTDLSSHVPCVYRETLLGFPKPSKKILMAVLLEQYTENNTRGDTMHMSSR